MYKEEVGYDKLLRVISETDELGGSHTYTYDKNGNMLRHICVRNGTQLDFQYTYDSTIKDKLLYMSEVKNGMKTAILDYSSTNKFLPTKIKYGDGSTKNLSWQGKRLTSITGSSLINYEYNAQGLRTSKTVDGDTTSYLYEGTKVIQMTKNVGDNQYVLDFVYDANGMLIGLNTTEGQYFYRRDITGNIIGILDSDGAYVVRYRYDAWGNLLYSTPSKPCIAANHNPFIYKGYMYDEETGWYYLQSRYYVPSLCRFLSPDSIDYADPETIGGLNLYAYCYNNPITYLDNAGNFAIKYSSYSVKLRSLMSIINIPGFDEVSYINTALDSSLKIAGKVLKHIGQTMYIQNVIADTILVSDKGVVNQLTLLNKSLATNIMNYGSLSTNISSTFSNLGKVLFVAGLAIDVYNDVTDPSLSAEQKIALTVSDVCFQGAIFALSCVSPVSAIIGIVAQWLYRKYLRDDIKELTR